MILPYDANPGRMEFSERTGVEGGKRNPSIAVLNRIAVALGSDISLLFDSSGRAKRPTR
jgi:transcriptional regulator with XRE-family HTH domain